MSNPKVHPAVLLSPVEDGYVAYDPVADRLHQLNPVAALLTELCDGSRSVAEVAELASPFLPEGETEAVAKWVAQATEAGLLTDAAGDGAAGELSAAELFKLTKRLREQGKAQTAHICIKRVVELEPQNSEAWFDLGEITHYLGRREEARAAYQKYFDANPHDGEVEHLLIALNDGPPPERASDRAIQHIYKNFAASYENLMLQDLKYAGPQRMMEAVQSVIGDRSDMTILDLGCGSGLAGVMFRPRAATLAGVDLSPEMVELARARNLYDRLEVGEVTQWLKDGDSRFDLIVSTDVIIYFGDLTAIIAAAARRLNPGGYFAFSTELGKKAPFHLTDTGRYSHHPDHVRACAAAAGLTVCRINEGFLRMEYGEEVTGLFAVLQKPA
ncbi:MAG: methyltransferase domain-containing protein [Alphaproteobacteria bacterium]|nr:methyltransferase domain-containing protein [Alphaproteobacteria bacterium]